ncbi:MAG: complement resistance protein TraT [Gammaproteobacteria bacterium]|nr:complement resistance protein TraT [Gammaproteobacteria bacterium]
MPKHAFFRFTLWLTLISFSVALTACGATQTLVKKRDLDVQTKMSKSVFLEPVAPEKRIIFLDVRNTSDKTLDITSRIQAYLKSRGYTLTDNPEEANFMLLANVLKVGKSDLRSSGQASDAGFGGAVIGAAVAKEKTGSTSSAVVGGVIGATAAIVADAMVDDTFFSMVTDIQVRERPLAGEVIQQKESTRLEQGTSTSINQQISGAKVAWKTYLTRVVSTANKANLKFEETLPELENGLVKAISGIF